MRTPTAQHKISISCERGAYMPHNGHRARCSCGWWSDCYAQLGDTQRAVEVHLRRTGLTKKTYGAAVADIVWDLNKTPRSRP
jgi:hypothetical protein